jgi:hypothetical protein
MESQDREPELELSLSQLSNRSLQLLQLHIKGEARQSGWRKRPRVEQLWHGNLQDDARALVILLQIGSVEPKGHEVTFHGHYQGSNLNHYWGTSWPWKGELGHHWYFDGPINPLLRNQRAAFVATILQRILEFLEM